MCYALYALGGNSKLIILGIDRYGGIFIGLVVMPEPSQRET
jgi:hypothetical protein